MQRNTIIILFVTISLIGLLIPIQTSYALTQGEPEFRVVDPEFGVHPGQSVNLTFQLQNDAEIFEGAISDAAINRITTARGVRVTVDEGNAPITVRSGTIGLGNVPEGQTPVTVRITVDEEADPGKYQVPVRIQYSATTRVPAVSGGHQELTLARTRHLTLTIDESSRFRIENTTSNVRLGEQGSITLEMRNIGEETARDASVHLTPSGSDLSFNEQPTSVTAIGAWEPNEVKHIPVDARVPRDMSIRGLGINAVVKYQDSAGIDTQSRQLQTAVTPRPAPSFSIVAVRESTQIGTTAPLEIVLENTGTETVTEATVGAAGTNSFMTIDGSQSGVTYVGTWEPGERRTATFDVGFNRDATPRSFGVIVDVRYHGATGDRIQSEQKIANVTPVAEQTFAFTDLASSLRVGAVGRIHGTIRNTGDIPVRDLSLSLPQHSSAVTDAGGADFLGTLEAGETAQFSIRGNVSHWIDPGRHQIDVAARYQTLGDDHQVTSHSITLDVAERQDAVSLSAPTTTYESGYSGAIRINATNELSEELRDIELRLVVEEPFESDFRTTMISSLEPGEMKQIAYDIDIDSDAPKSQFPLAFEVRYTNLEGDRLTMPPAWVTLSVTDSESDFLQAELLVFVVLALLVVGVFVWLYRR